MLCPICLSIPKEVGEKHSIQRYKSPAFTGLWQKHRTIDIVFKCCGCGRRGTSKHFVPNKEWWKDGVMPSHELKFVCGGSFMKALCIRLKRRFKRKRRED